IWEEIEKQNQATAEVDQAKLEAKFQAEVIALVKPRVDLARPALKALEAASVPALQAARRARESVYFRDSEVSYVVHEIENLAQNGPTGIRAGLEYFERLSPQMLLLRSGAINVNAAPQLVGTLRSYLSGVPDHARALGQFVERLEARLAYLLEHDQYQAAIAGSQHQSQYSAVTIKQPEKNSPTVEIIPTIIEFDARDPHLFDPEDR